jgi:peroxiredoxin
MGLIRAIVIGFLGIIAKLIMPGSRRASMIEMHPAAASRPAGICRRKFVLAALLCAGLCMPVAPSTAADTEPGAGVTALVPHDGSAGPLFALPSLDGAPQELSRQRGRVVLVHFFATWCEPCRPEMARLRALQARLAGRPIAIVAISVAEADGAVRRFFAADPVPFTILLDRDRAVAKSWSIHTLPSTVVLDHDLKPRFIAEGDVDWARDDVTGILADLIGAVPPATGAGGG